MKLLVATTNPDKLREIRAVRLPSSIEIVTLGDIPPVAEPSEDGATFWENARRKAMHYARASGLSAVAEDSGLEIAAFGGEPGVHSARFLGAGVSYAARFEEIYRRFSQLPPATPRDARFVTALAVSNPAGELLFETQTVIDGRLADRPAGHGGFGYDPIFFYPPFARTTAEMSYEEKGVVSHRARAFRDLAAFCKNR